MAITGWCGPPLCAWTSAGQDHGLGPPSTWWPRAGGVLCGNGPQAGGPCWASSSATGKRGFLPPRVMTVGGGSMATGEVAQRRSAKKAFLATIFETESRGTTWGARRTRCDA
jgi:hypothetical protein